MTRGPSNRSLMLTPPGAGAIAVVRIVGPDADSIVGKSFRPARRGSCRRTETQDSTPDSSGSVLFAGDHLRYGRFVVDDEVIDDVIVARVPTAGVPAFDISAHGGVRVIERILEALERDGAPLCDLADSPDPVWPAKNRIEEEAVQAVSLAKTPRAIRFLAWQRRHLVPHVLDIAHLCLQNPDLAREALHALLTIRRRARYLIEGATIAIAGPPNSGKSTLFNALLGRSATLVSSAAGTTRDWVTASAEMDGVPVTLIDTAGRREPTGDLERRAIQNGWAKAAQADLCVVLFDGSQPLSPATLEVPAPVDPREHRLFVANKCDLPDAWESIPSAPGRTETETPIRVSALSGDGLEELVAEILCCLGFAGEADTLPALLTARQVELVEQALSDLPEDPRAAESRLRCELVGSSLGDTRFE